MNPQREKALPRVRHLSKPLVTLLAGVLLGACLMFVGLARAGRLAPPPRPEVLLDGLMRLQDKIRGRKGKLVTPKWVQDYASKIPDVKPEGGR